MLCEFHFNLKSWDVVLKPCDLSLLREFRIAASVKSEEEDESESEVAQSCPTLCDPVNWGPPGSSVLGILQARILEWVAISFSRETSQPRDRTQVSHIAGRHFTIWATREVPQEYWSGLVFPSPGDFPNPGIEPRSPALWADTLTSEPPGNIHTWLLEKP